MQDRGRVLTVLDQKISEFIRRAAAGEAGEDEFNSISLEVFTHQFSHNTAYRKFCEGRGVSPATSTPWDRIPPVPVSAFKACDFSCFPVNTAIRRFETSGTTTRTPGRHFFDTLALYEESALPNFKTHLLPDGQTIPARVLLPPPAEAPHSSLAYMCGIVTAAFSPDTRWYIHEQRLDVEAIIRDFEGAELKSEPRMILGPAFSFVHLFDALDTLKRRFALPAGSRIMETGGYKGRSRELNREQFLEAAERKLGISAGWVVNEYGMTELTSQMYTDVLQKTLSPTEAIHMPPPWIRVRILDPITAELAEPGTPGLIQIWDPANRGSAMAIQTEDVGLMIDGGLRLFGRIEAADPRGCSIAVDELLSKQ